MTKYFEEINDGKNKLTLFCFPYAGGGASVFRNWQDNLDSVVVRPAHLKGHEERIMETALDDMDKLVDELYEEVKNISKTPFYLFGHSVGSRIAYELALRFQKDKNKLLKGVIVSAGLAPDREEENPIFDLPDQEFYEGISRYNHTPSEIFKNKDLWNIFGPVLRADFKLADTYCNKSEERLKVPILGLRGTRDKEISSEDLLEWGIYSDVSFYGVDIEGEHLFIDTNTKDVIKAVDDFIENTYKELG